MGFIFDKIQSEGDIAFLIVLQTNLTIMELVILNNITKNDTHSLHIEDITHIHFVLLIKTKTKLHFI